VDILSKYPQRLDALTYALASPDTDTQPKIKMWAVTELARLRTQEGVNALVSYAIDLQKRYYDEKGAPKPVKDDRFSRRAWDVYNEVIAILTAKGTDRSSLNRMGLYPQAFFRPTP